MDAEVSLVLISSCLSDAAINIAAGLEPTSVSFNKDKQKVWSRDSGDIRVDDVEVAIIKILAGIRPEFADIEVRQIWVRIHSNSDFAGLALTNRCLQCLAKGGVDFFISTYAEGNDWGEALTS